jgi:hypothetical protein
MPDLPCDGGRLYELLRGGRFLLVDTTGRLRGAEPWADRVRPVRAAAAPGVPAVVLVRPDGYVAWAGDPTEAAVGALTRWCGAPAPSPELHRS